MAKTSKWKRYWNSTTVLKETERNTTFVQHEPTEIQCRECDGTGKRPGRPCGYCQGRGQTTSPTEFTVAYRQLLPRDADADADPQSMPLLIDGARLSVFEMRQLALQMWWRSFTDDGLPETPDGNPATDWVRRHAVEARNGLVARLLASAEDVMQERVYENDRLGDDSFDQYVATVIDVATGRLLANLPMHRFVTAIGSYRDYYQQAKADARSKDLVVEG